MLISDVSVKRPVFAIVVSLLLFTFGVVSYERLPLREYPNIDPPVVTVDVTYPGAPANIVESRVTQLVEDRIAGIDGILYVNSTSRDGRSSVTIEFSTARDINDAANDVRDKVSRIRDDLPDEALAPDVEKADSNEDVIIWQNLVSDRMSVPELTDYADRYLVNQYSTLNGVARVRVGGGLRYALRIWLDHEALAARDLVVEDVTQALRRANLEAPAGALETDQQLIKLRVEKVFKTPEDFQRLVIAGDEGRGFVYLGDVARVEKGVEEDRIMFRGNGIPMVGIGVIRQSNANLIAVARQVKETSARLQPGLPEGMSIEQSFDASVFVEESINEVYKTFGFALVCVILVILLFLGQLRLVLIPAITVPVAITATFTLLALFGLSVNLLTLLALVLAIGLVVDDAIVMLENVHRRVEKYGENPIVAAYNGAREVGFAIIATTLVLVAVFVPFAFMQGYIGQLFSEFAIALSTAVLFSSFIALTLTPVLCAKIIRLSDVRKNSGWQERLANSYKRSLEVLIYQKSLMVVGFVLLCGLAYWLQAQLPQALTPKEDRGAFYIMVNGPEGANYDFIEKRMDEIERRMMPYVESGEINRLLIRAPRGFGSIENFNTGFVIVVLNHWSERRPAWPILNEIRGKLSDLAGVRAFPVMRQGIGGRTEKPLQFVLGGPDYDTLLEWQDILLEKVKEDNPGLLSVETDYKPTRPQIDIHIDYQQAAELDITPEAIGFTLETLFSGRRVTTWSDRGEEYDVYVEGEPELQREEVDIKSIYVRSGIDNELVPLSQLVTLRTYGAAESLSRYNKVRAVTFSADLEDSLSLPDALRYMENLVRTHLPAEASIDYKGRSLDIKRSGDQILFVFVFGLIVVYLVLAAQFESFRHPWTIMVSVPLAILGGLIGIYVVQGTLNIYSQIGLIMLVGLAAKNGILIVEFANQLREKGESLLDAILHASAQRFRPIIMTNLTTVAGAIPLIFAQGAGAETRIEIGVVIFSGVIVSVLLTLYIVPVAYLFFSPKSINGNFKEVINRQA